MSTDEWMRLLALRDHFAGLAMQAQIAGQPGIERDDRLPVWSYDIADAMMAERAARLSALEAAVDGVG